MILGKLADSEEDPRRRSNYLQRPEIQTARATGFGAAVRRSDTVMKSLQYVAVRIDNEHSAVAYARIALPVVFIQQELAWFEHAIWSVAACMGSPVTGRRRRNRLRGFLSAEPPNQSLTALGLAVSSRTLAEVRIPSGYNAGTRGREHYSASLQ
jgi:hypothetical protein